MAVGRNLVASVLPAIAGCSLLVDVPAVVEGGGSDDVRRKEIRLHAELGQALEDMPVPIVLIEDPGLVDRARFENIHFTDDSDQPVPYEVEIMDREAGTLAAWVRLPIINPDTTLLHVYYGGPDIEDPPDPSSVWSEAYAGVWHLSNEPPRYFDSTFGGNLMEPATEAVPDPIEGAFGNGIIYDGESDRRLVVADNDSLDAGTGTIAVTVWVRVEQSAGADDVPFSKGGLSQDSPGYGIHMGNGDWSVSFSDGDIFTQLVIGPDDSFLGGWHLLGLQLKREEGTNGACVQQDGFEGLCTSDADGLDNLGSLSNDEDIVIGSNYEGRIDEIRIYREPIQREALLFESQARTKIDFYDVGPEQVP